MRHWALLAFLLVLPAEPVWATYRIQRDDRGIWITASGDEFPNLLIDRPHNGAMFYRIDQRKIYVWTESITTIPDRGFWTEYTSQTAATVTYPLLAPNGSAAAPSYSFADAPNTGIFSTNGPIVHSWGVSINGGTGGAGKPFILMTDGQEEPSISHPLFQLQGVLPAVTDSTAYGMVLHLSTSGSDDDPLVGFGINYLLGYSGSAPTSGILVDSDQVSTSTLSGSVDTTDANVAIRGLASPLNGTPGTSIGVLGYSENLGTGGHVGVLGEAMFDRGDRGFGVIGHGSTEGVGGYFLNRSTTPAFTLVPGLATALIADNGAQTNNRIFSAFHNGSARWSVQREGAVWAKVGTKTLTEGSATTFVRILSGSGVRVGGTISYCVDADDGTDYQTRCGSVPFAQVNKAGTETCALGTPTDVLAETTGSSTLTVTFTGAGGVDDCGWAANATSSLTQTTLRINYSVQQNGNSPGFTTAQ